MGDATDNWERPEEGSVRDEYGWEALIRGQDARADEYLALLEYYGDEKDAHNIIARAMGWRHLLTNCTGEPDPRLCRACPGERSADCGFYRTYSPAFQGDPPGGETREMLTLSDDELEEQVALAEWNIRYLQHPIHVQAVELVARLNELCAALPDGCPDARNPLTRLLRCAHCCVGKIAAALGGYSEPDMLGLVVAYLKTASHACSVGIGEIAQCVASHDAPPPAGEDLTRRLLDIRAQLAELIDEFRAHLRRAGEGSA